MPFESGPSASPRPQEKTAGVAAMALAALVSAACERIPQPGDNVHHYASVYDRLSAEGAGRHTPTEVLRQTLPVNTEATTENAERPAAEYGILSFQGYRGPGTNLAGFNELAGQTFGNKIIRSQEVANPNGGTYLNHVVIPFTAASPEAINGHRVVVSYEFTRTDLTVKNIGNEQYTPAGAMIGQRMTLGVTAETAPRGPALVTQNQAGTGQDYTTALNDALTLIVRPGDADAIQADFERIRAAARARHDPNHGAQCGIVQSQDMGQSFYCTTRTQRTRTLVIDNVQQSTQADGSVRVDVLYHDPAAPVPSVLPTPGT